MSTLRNKTGSALVWDLLGNYSGQIIGFIISIFLARLLTPEEFGLVGMSMVFISVLNVFTDMGFASALIQTEKPSSLIYSSVFFVNIAAGLALTLLVYVCAPLIGNFYNQDQITELVRLLALSFLFSSLNITQRTIYKRNLKFKVLTLRAITSQVIAGIVSIILAFKGYGVYALVWRFILSQLIDTIILWKVSEWTPKWEFSWKEVKNLTNFSAYVFGAQSVNEIIMRSNTLVIGKLFSPATLGFFARANSLNSLINKNTVRSISQVFFPVLSTIRDDDQQFNRVYLKVVDLIAAVAFFLTGAFFLIGEELIIGLYGEKWEPSILIFQVLIVRGFTYPISAMIVNAFLAKGKSKENFKYGNYRKILQLFPLVVAFLYGFYPMLYAFIVASYCTWLLNNYFVTRSLNISFKKQLKAVLPHLLLTAGLVFLIEYFFPDRRSYFLAVLKFITFTIIFVGYQFVFKTEIYLEIKRNGSNIWVLLRKLLKRK